MSTLWNSQVWRRAVRHSESPVPWNGSTDGVIKVESVELPRRLSGQESTCQCRRCGFYPRVRKIPWRRKWQPTPVFSPRKSHGQSSLAGHRPWGHKESDTTECLSAHAKQKAHLSLSVMISFSVSINLFNKSWPNKCSQSHEKTHVDKAWPVFLVRSESVGWDGQMNVLVSCDAACCGVWKRNLLPGLKSR